MGSLGAKKRSKKGKKSFFGKMGDQISAALFKAGKTNAKAFKNDYDSS